MCDDWFVSAVQAVEATARDVHESVDGVVEMLKDAAEERSGGSSVHAVVAGLVDKGGRDARLAPTVAYERFEAAVTAYRARAITALVDEEGLSFTAVGRLTGVSRQMVARLYRSSEERSGTR
jgi:hypothetical protein